MIHVASKLEEVDSYPSWPDILPNMALTSGPYTLQFAASKKDLHEIYKLRFDVFNVELQEGLESSLVLGRDEDAFDPYCHHMFIRDTRTSAVVGTYRMQTRKMARAGIGWYSESEFNFSEVPESVLDISMEVGRACIAIDHRSLQVLYLLWRGLGLYLSHNKLRFLFGCCSLTSQNEIDGYSVLSQLKKRNVMLNTWNVQPLPTHVCCSGAPTDRKLHNVKIPRLMRAYLALGAKICGPPAIDRMFKTIDFLALFDVDVLSSRAMSFYRIQR